MRQQLPGFGVIRRGLHDGNQQGFRLRVLARLNKVCGDVERGVVIHGVNFRLFAAIAILKLLIFCGRHVMKRQERYGAGEYGRAAGCALIGDRSERR